MFLLLSNLVPILLSKMKKGTNFNFYDVLCRVNCPYMFLQHNFIQRKFIDGMQGQRFSFNDKIILNVFSLNQTIDITPEVDSLLKVQVKEAFGVNAAIVLCQGIDCTS